jgi:hypothetical protein
MAPASKANKQRKAALAARFSAAQTLELDNPDEAVEEADEGAGVLGLMMIGQKRCGCNMNCKSDR